MGLLSPILRGGDNGHLAWFCPGCRKPHAISHGPGKWTWNGNAEKPSFSPSVLVTWPANPDASDEFAEWRTERRCHSFVVDGQMQMLADSTHPLAGQTVPIPPWPYPKPAGDE